MKIQLVECPRDAMQGLHNFVPTALKIDYINTLLSVGFDTLDFGSFVSPKAIPQMKDTAEVLEKLEWTTATKLLAIVANVRGAEQAVAFDKITYLGFPLSISETFQQRNTNASIAEALHTIATIQELCLTHHKTLVVYLSMGFGNPYGDDYSVQYLVDFTAKLARLGVQIIAPSDTVGSSTPILIKNVFEMLIPAFPEINFGAHLHATPDTHLEKLEAAVEAGCRRFDGAIRGFGGCPMASDALTGNISTEHIIDYFENKNVALGINQHAFQQAYDLSAKVFQYE
jgi:hydroxymethylglutaryl-CoA lyase